MTPLPLVAPLLAALPAAAALPARAEPLQVVPAQLVPGQVVPGKASAPIPASTLALMTAKGTTPAAPLVLRSYKKESEIEVWKENRGGRFVFVKTFPICRWSGQLGPKRRAGDRQTPEGFYPVGPRQMNPNSHYYLSFDTGFPNAYDRAHGWSGSAVMVHGTCSSMGCFAMTDRAVGEIYAIARDALAAGQPAFQLQAYPFRMSAANMALYRNDPDIDFWRQLKEGSDRFEATGEILSWRVAAGRYAFAPSADPGKEAAAQAYHAAELARIAEAVRDGSAAVRTTYADGGQNAIFAALLKKGADLGTVSRPEALAYAGIDVTLVPAHRRPRVKPAAPIAVARADWVPEPRPAAAAALKVHVADPPGSVGPWAFAVAPGYAWRSPSGGAALIAGAMPMRPAFLAN